MRRFEKVVCCYCEGPGCGQSAGTYDDPGFVSKATDRFFGLGETASKNFMEDGRMCKAFNLEF